MGARRAARYGRAPGIPVLHPAIAPAQAQEHTPRPATLDTSTRTLEERHTHSGTSPLGQGGLAILALRKLHRQPCCFHLYPVTAPLGVHENCVLNL
jgi:hypothetical protein